LRHSLTRCLLAFVTVSTFALPSIADESKVTIVLIGDSYLSSFNVDPNDSFGVKLEEALNAGPLPVDVLDTGFTGTAFSGASHLDGLMNDPSVLATAPMHAVIVELGQNDCRRYTLEETRAALDSMLARFAEAHIPALVVDTAPYDHCERAARPNYNALYVQMFADLASKYGYLYYRDFKDGVTGHPDLMQHDHDHPNAQGDAVIVAKMLPVVQELVARVTKP
jgi:acyl-CoA thioesterase I